MGGPVTNLPRGLLGLLGAKTFGTSPSYLGETMVPTVDVGPMFSANNYQFASDVVIGAILSGGNGQNWPLTGNMYTPIGKIRIPIAYGLIVICGAGEALQITPTITLNTQTSRSTAIGQPISVPASVTTWAGIALPPGLVLTPGMGFGYQIGAITGAVDIGYSYLFAEFDAGG